MAHAGKVLTYAALVFWSLVCVFPLYWAAVTSLKDEMAIVTSPHYLPFIDFTPQLDAWVFIFTDATDTLLPRLINSSVVAVTSTVLTLALGSMAAYGLSRFRVTISWAVAVCILFAAGLFGCVLLATDAWTRACLAAASGVALMLATKLPRRGPGLRNDGVVFAILASRVIPPIAILGPLYLMARATDLLDTRLALIVTYTAANLPAAIWLLLPVLGPRPSEQEDAAILEGATHADILLTVVLPMQARSVAGVGLLIFVLCWNEYLLAASLAFGHAMTLPPWTVDMVSVREAKILSEGDEWSHLGAAIIFVAAPLVIIAALTHRVVGRIGSWQR